MAVKTEMHAFLNAHRTYFVLLRDSVYLGDDSLVHSIELTGSDPRGEFYKLDDVIERVNRIEELMRSGTEHYSQFVWSLSADEIFERAKTMVGKEQVGNADVKGILESRFFVDDVGVKTKCSNYEELREHVHRRIDNYCDSQVSVDRIDELSFKFNGPIENFEDKTSCGICFDDFENGQEICHLQCNHFLCRNCAEKWFKIPESGSDANFQCPFCRDDCT